MRMILATTILTLLLPVPGHAGQEHVYRWVDKDGQVHYGDSIPADAADFEKQVVNATGVPVDTLRGKRTAEEIAEELRQQELKAAIDEQRRQDAALLATYLTLDEITMHRDRRVELFQAQARVTELYLRNLERRLESLMDEAKRYRPYSEDPDAQMMPADLGRDIQDTRKTIDRHQGNLARFHKDEREIIARFDVDITRFKELKGLN
ncbi:MAG: DUF4124 domain-containing protein [Gammaproteobacteria bacterium]|nr:DUF4124 domain-containing protein [Gammaproteobacteria bacterium]MDH5309673.1 DUF4124 domain-containing protein [Gammaproteobacteria bacterium]